MRQETPSEETMETYLASYLELRVQDPSAEVYGPPTPDIGYTKPACRTEAPSREVRSLALLLWHLALAAIEHLFRIPQLIVPILIVTVPFARSLPLGRKARGSARLSLHIAEMEYADMKEEHRRLGY